MNTIMLMYHDDSCGELLDSTGMCPKCSFHPDMQSTGFMDVPLSLYYLGKAASKTYLGRHREPK